MEQKLISILLNTDNYTFNLAIVERQSNRVDGIYYSVHEILLDDIESKDNGRFLDNKSLKLINIHKAKGYDFKEKILSWCPDSYEAFPINPGTKNYRKSLKENIPIEEEDPETKESVLDDVFKIIDDSFK